MDESFVNVCEVAFNSIFNDDSKLRYEVPIYQREYAWGNLEIMQMMTDLWEAFQLNPHRKYYLGTLVVTPGSGQRFQVIDGQQRLTTLSLLAGLMKIRLQTPVVCFETRRETNRFLREYCQGDFAPESDKTLPSGLGGFGNAIKLLGGFRPALPPTDERELDEHELSIRTGLLEETNKGVSFASFIQKMVTLFQVCMPKDTDAMDYFEVMNNRGEQLEFHELLKAKLMAKLHTLCNSANAPESIRGKYEDLSHRFNLLWTACSKMNGHLVDHLHACYQLQCNPEMSWIDLAGDIASGDLDGRDVQHERQSVITDFSNFLMHALRLYVEEKFNVPLDERKIEETFSEIDERMRVDPVRFLQVLLHARLDFDRLVVKAKIENDVVVEWRLKEIVNSNDKYYAKCTFGSNEEASENEMAQKKLVYLESALQVSNATQRYKEWVYKILSASAAEKKDGNCLLQLLENFTATRISDAEQYWRLKGRSLFRLGLQTPRLLLNVIDYLMWKSSEEHRGENFIYSVPSMFVFSYNNSIEHHHAKCDDTGDDVWNDEEKDDIGNLYLTSHSENSSMGKHRTKEKVSIYKHAHDGKVPSNPKRNWMYTHTGDSWSLKEMNDHSKYISELVSAFLKK